jgi:hypothetical protein
VLSRLFSFVWLEQKSKKKSLILSNTFSIYLLLYFLLICFTFFSSHTPCLCLSASLPLCPLVALSICLLVSLSLHLSLSFSFPLSLSVSILQASLSLHLSISLPFVLFISLCFYSSSFSISSSLHLSTFRSHHLSQGYVKIIVSVFNPGKPFLTQPLLWHHNFPEWTLLNIYILVCRFGMIPSYSPLVIHPSHIRLESSAFNVTELFKTHQ